jgi:ATP-dependent Lhr-like helicase
VNSSPSSRSSRGALAGFHPAVAEWFAATFAKPTRAQQLGWPEIQAGRSTLVFAPTGSGKTLAAFLAAIDRLMFAPVPDKTRRCRVLYVSPLRALAFDVERNLRAPLVGIGRAAERRGDAFHLPAVGLRTGDTPQAERARLARTPPDVLITTPESLYLMLTSNARALLASVETVIVDEIHALVATKRGAHLALSLERVQELASRELQRVGLSATQRPLDEVARFLGGGQESGAAAPVPRPVSIVDARAPKTLELRVEVPVEDMSRLGEALVPQPGGEIAFGPASVVPRRSIWPALHPRLLELVRAHRSTILFVNSRRLAERLAGALNELAGEDVARAHHGSIAREQRLEIEDALKAGRLAALVATSSLELGIDMGAVDLVVQIETPPSVASGLQRIGRAGHQAGAVSRGVLFPKYRGDLLATAAITRAMVAGEVEQTRVPRNPLDVLAQQLVAICALGERRVDELFALARRAAPFSALPRAQFEGVLDMLAGRYPSDEFAELRPRLTWDRLRGVVRAREGSRRLAVTNAGTIPDRGLYGVFLAEGAAGAPPATPGGTPSALGYGTAGAAPGSQGAHLRPSRARHGRRVGELDEEMVFESREGDVFVLGASSWRIVEITRDQVLVVPAPGEPGRMPFWKADRAARPVELGRHIGRLARELLEQPRETALERLRERHFLEAQAAENLLAYLDEQKAAGVVPDERTLVLERSRDEMGDFRLCLLSPLGGRVHAPWALALQARLRGTGLPEVETVWSNDGIVIRLPDCERPPDAAALLPDPDEIEELVTRELAGSALFAATFREAAARALLLPRRRPGQRSPLWMQRKRAADLLGVASRFASFPIVLETYRECLRDVFDLPALVDVARRVLRREMRLVTVDTTSPSPFAASLLFGYVANYLYEGDAPLAERRAHALTVDPRQLRELLGEAELRELLDARVLDEAERALQALDAGHHARSPDRVHDLLLRLGDLSAGEIAARCEPASSAEAWIAALVDERRAVRVVLAGEERLAAIEDLGRLRDAFGVPPPPGVPRAFLDPVPDALAGVIARWARTHGPFPASDVARRYGLGTAPVEAALERLAAAGRVLEGEFRPGGHGREWCDAEVLASLRRRSLARLRREVEPAEPAALARLLLDWQGIAAGASSAAARGGADALLDVIEQLQGVALPASALERDVLPARLPGYQPQDLDLLCSAGEVAWVGIEPLGERDGRVALYLADDLRLLKREPAGEKRPSGELHERLRACLARQGASFFAAIHAEVGGWAREALDALWDLVWAGEVVNDSPAALRAFLGAATRTRRAPSRRLTPFRSRRDAPPSAAGRWSLLGTLVPGAPPTPTERAAALGEQLLSRWGVLTRDAIVAEDVPGGFSALYPVLRALEEAGRIRRGYFIAGLGGSQFAHPGALERLRALRESSSGVDDGATQATDAAGVVLAATDPASPYGAALPWPKSDAARPMRAAGAHVVLVGGVLAAFIGRGAKELHAFLPSDEPARSRHALALCRALATWMARTGRAFIGADGVDGGAAATGALAPHLNAAGLVPYGPGLRLAPPAPPVTTRGPAPDGG